MPYKNITKQKRAQHASYLRHKDKILRGQRENRETINDQTKQRRSEKVKLLQDLKDNQPCADCGAKRRYYVMDFDHVRGEKLGKVSALVAADVSWRMILDEIAKCDLVCANCHRERTHQRGQDLGHLTDPGIIDV